MPAFHPSLRKSQKKAPKFYWFDVGVKRALEGTLDVPPNPRTSFFGELFEHFVILEAYRLNQYKDRNFRLSHFQNYDDGEVDLVLQKSRRKPLLIEIKSTEEADEKEIRKLARHGKTLDADQMFYLSRDPVSKTLEGVHCLSWNTGLKHIFGEIL